MKEKVFLKGIKSYLSKINAEKEKIISEYYLNGTDDINEMVGKVGFIDNDGRFYPVRVVIENREQAKNMDIISHESWARMYLRYILKRSSNISNPVGVLIQNFGMGMVYETFDDNGGLELCFLADKASDIQRKHFDELNRLWLGSRLKRKGR